jgi:uncharacterized membrane protein YgdD (TMEM256/DUF423 family)
MRSRLHLLLIASGGFFAATSVGLSAVVAHMTFDPELSVSDRASVNLALQFMLIHSVAIVAVPWRLPALLWVFAIVMFSGGILASKLLQLPLAFITPWGGSGLILGWLLLSACAIREAFLMKRS